MDFLDFQIRDIEDINPKEDEDIILPEKIKNIKNKKQWQSWIQESVDCLSNSDRNILGQLKGILTRTPQDSRLDSIKEQITQGFMQLEDAAFGLQQLLSQDFGEEECLEDLEDRLSRLRKIQKKFGSQIPEILKRLEQMKKDYDNLNCLSENLTNFRRDHQREKQNLLRLCEKLRNQRKSGALRLTREVNRELKELNMKGVEFFVAVLDHEVSSTGSERVVFQIRSGKKDQNKDIAQVASGGELSRILLSLKQVVGIHEHPRTFLFDEVDSGVSGSTAEKVGFKLKILQTVNRLSVSPTCPRWPVLGIITFLLKRSFTGTMLKCPSLLSIKTKDQRDCPFDFRGKTNTDQF